MKFSPSSICFLSNLVFFAVSLPVTGEILLSQSNNHFGQNFQNFKFSIYCINTGIPCKYMLPGMYMLYNTMFYCVNKYVFCSSMSFGSTIGSIVLMSNN